MKEPMKFVYKIMILAFIITGLAACATGKNAFDKGDYTEAIDKSINRLKSNPNNKKAKQVLIDGYQAAMRFHLNNIKQFDNSTDTYKWERIFSQYALLNRYFRDINGCPSCFDAVKPQSFF